MGFYSGRYARFNKPTEQSERWCSNIIPLEKRNRGPSRACEENAWNNGNLSPSGLGTCFSTIRIPPEITPRTTTKTIAKISLHAIALTHVRGQLSQSSDPQSTLAGLALMHETFWLL